jgi:hypothetical protein
MNLADRLRELAERLPTGGSLTLTRDGLLELATGAKRQPDELPSQAEFTISELAARFHRSASTVRGWCEHGCFDGAYKLNGRDWRIPQASIDAFVSKQRGARSVVGLGAWRAVRRAELPRRG